jgi:hypothetical protein
MYVYNTTNQVRVTMLDPVPATLQLPLPRYLSRTDDSLEVFCTDGNEIR